MPTNVDTVITIEDWHKGGWDAEAARHSCKDDSQAQADALAGPQHVKNVQGLQALIYPLIRLLAESPLVKERLWPSSVFSATLSC